LSANIAIYSLPQAIGDGCDISGWFEAVHEQVGKINDSFLNFVDLWDHKAAACVDLIAEFADETSVSNVINRTAVNWGTEAGISV
jgi:hypothetical protein